METRFLKTLMDVAETGSLAATARRLNITPSAVVQRIRALEAEIGYPLIRRVGQSTRPTAEGAAILPGIAQLIAVEDELRAAASLDRQAGLLRVGVIQSALTGLLPELLTRLRQEHPNVELYIQPGTSSDLYAAVAANEIDLAILIRPGFALPKSVVWRPLRRETMLLIAPDALAGGEPLAMLQREPFIRYDRNHWGGQLVEHYLRRHRLRVRERYELDSLEAITILVSRGLGVAIVPDWLPPWPANSPVHRQSLDDAPARHIGMVWSASSLRRGLIELFAGEAEVVVAQNGWSGVAGAALEHP